jgi:hypothetical protein
MNAASVQAMGKRRWAIAAGQVPVGSNGPEPAFTSRDQFSILNTGADSAHVRVEAFYSHRPSVGPFRVTVAPRRMRQLRINDLIFPEAIRLGEPIGLVFTSDVPVIVQYGRCDTRARANAGFMPMGWSAN